MVPIGSLGGGMFGAGGEGVKAVTLVDRAFEKTLLMVVLKEGTRSRRPKRRSS